MSRRRDVRGVIILNLINALDPAEFENLIFDCVGAAGLKNVVWRTPGADGGRDIEGLAYIRDLSGQESVHRWYVECKRYSSSIDWPTVWQKISYADVQGADVLLIATNSNPSPRCETEIEAWNAARRRPLIRFWRGYDLPKIVRNSPAIGANYGLLTEQTLLEASSLPLALLVSKIVQASYSTNLFGGDPQLSLQTAAALSELLSQRVNDIKVYGKFVPAAFAKAPPDYDWLTTSGYTGGWEEVGLRAVLSTILYMHHATAVEGTFDENRLKIKIDGSRWVPQHKAHEDLNTVASWSRIEVSADVLSENSYTITQR